MEVFLAFLQKNITITVYEMTPFYTHKIIILRDSKVPTFRNKRDCFPGKKLGRNRGHRFMIRKEI